MDPKPQADVPVGRFMKGVSSNTSLPPSVEAAYYKKCIALKQRIAEIEIHNDTYRRRQIRIQRAITKMRLERFFLLEQIESRTDWNFDESDLSDSPFPTPSERPLRAKRNPRPRGSPTASSVQLQQIKERGASPSSHTTAQQAARSWDPTEAQHGVLPPSSTSPRPYVAMNHDENIDSLGMLQWTRTSD